jgi:hypothetical protein
MIPFPCGLEAEPEQRKEAEPEQQREAEPEQQREAEPEQQREAEPEHARSRVRMHKKCQRLNLAPPKDRDAQLGRRPVAASNVDSQAQPTNSVVHWAKQGAATWEALD